MNRARETNQLFNELLQYYAMERFLYRVSRSEYVEQFILKGALLLRISGISEIRSTRDIDFLGMDDTGIEKMKGVIAECCNWIISGYLSGDRKVNRSDIYCKWFYFPTLCWK